jgi:hypothetical protein
MLHTLAVLAALVPLLLPGLATAQGAPGADPPRLEGLPEPAPRPRAGGGSVGLLAEWTLHKTADGAHPDGVEQAYVWLMNRARQDPAAEGVFLAGITQFGVPGALRYFGVDLALLEAEFAAIAPKPPAAFDVRLYEGALAHSLDLIARDAQDHSGQFDRVSAAGFRAQGMRGNVFSYSREPLYGHAAFNVDWGGNDGTGMQNGRGHRKAIMSSDGDYANVGIAAVPELSPSTKVGTSVVTGNYARASASAVDHHNRFLVGTVWEDLDGDGLYDPDEGIEGVEVLPSRGPWFAVTAAGGGYAVPILEPGPVAVEFSGAGVPFHTVYALVEGTSVLVDYELSSTVARVPEPRGGAAGLAAGLALAGLAGRAGRVRRARTVRPRTDQHFSE